ncbi:MAG: helix-turn-helix domain-containing protein [Aggregatilineales bacterium]
MEGWYAVIKVHLAEEVHSVRSSRYGKKPTAKPFLHPAGLETISSASMSKAVHLLLAQLYRGMIEVDAPVSDMIPEKDVRNQAIYYRYLAGERVVDLAREFGISVRRVNRLIRRYLNRGQM